MKNSMVLATLMLTCGAINAKKVYSVDYENQADVKVFVVQ